MSNIPTAEEFLREKPFSIESIYNNMIEFAKLHVEAALKEASEKAKLEYGLKYASGVNKDSILNAYPLTLIK